ncbi:MAG: thioredoxin fold domain-containing protein [Chitinophagaceae bacterium]|nr:thioredoxin fold domain-containing protein [Chitinophagaceae bacterium]MCB9044646.1 thioredoxin fold domain-containing protein [Chitinophagales bacterium]
MKKIVLLVVLISSLGIKGLAQEQKADTLPYLKYPVLPSFEILLPDSTEKFSTYYIPEGRPIVMMFFSPDCDHCVRFTEQLLEHKDDFKKTRIYMITPMTLAATKVFADKMGLDKHKNIKWGKDYQYFFISFYGVKSFPFVAVYDGKKKLIEGFPGHLTIEDVIKAVERAK